MAKLIGINLAAVIAAAIGLAADWFLWIHWSLWSQGSFGDCPDYAFGANWYPEPPLGVLLIPILMSLIGIAIWTCVLVASRRNGQRSLVPLSLAALVFDSVPVVAGVVVPLISELAHLSRPGC